MQTSEKFWKRWSKEYLLELRECHHTYQGQIQGSVQGPLFEMILFISYKFPWVSGWTPPPPPFFFEENSAGPPPPPPFKIPGSAPAKPVEEWRMLLPIARVEDHLRGRSSDGMIWAARVKTQSKTGRPTLPIEHLYPLEVDLQERKAGDNQPEGTPADVSSADTHQASDEDPSSVASSPHPQALHFRVSMEIIPECPWPS